MRLFQSHHFVRPELETFWPLDDLPGYGTAAAGRDRNKLSSPRHPFDRCQKLTFADRKSWMSPPNNRSHGAMGLFAIPVGEVEQSALDRDLKVFWQPHALPCSKRTLVLHDCAAALLVQAHALAEDPKARNIICYTPQPAALICRIGNMPNRCLFGHEKEPSMTNEKHDNGVYIPKTRNPPTEIDQNAGMPKNPHGNGLSRTAGETNDETRQSDQAGSMANPAETDAKGQYAKPQSGGDNDGVASVDPVATSGANSGDATFKHTYKGIDKE
ncbi:hypothetical protein [Aliihoeflea sp. 40Bstr573]|uniref:hypothetical protein n=1 Tax=Aliihoeflea sp. 40Bstr573 TaxID=2696467 RepID=UPI0020942303|nr:hypothetical protein [Aliihoeflea sp. 40Bstr573]MCO6388467.1 hypothetical protein [Aliihoeflea sp. 40Bstr573]